MSEAILPELPDSIYTQRQIAIAGKSGDLRRVMTRTLFALSFLALTGTLAFSAPRPRMEFVADEATAVKIAIAAWEDAYGAEKIEDQKPFSAVLRGNIWQVQPSSLRRELGGRLYAEVVKADGTIRSIRLIK